MCTTWEPFTFYMILVVNLEHLASLVKKVDHYIIAFHDAIIRCDKDDNVWI